MIMRIFALARITFLEGIRNRSVFGILLFSLFILGLNVAVAGFFMREVGKVTIDMNLAALSFSGLLLVFFVGLGLVAKDIDKKTIQLVLSKPISRVQYVWGKYLGIMSFVSVSLSVLFILSSATVFLIQSLYPAYFEGLSWPIFLLAGFFILVKLAVVSAIVVLFTTLTTSSFITLIFSVCAYIVGQTIEDVVFYLKSGFSSEEIQISETLRLTIEIFSYILPNLSAFDFQTAAAHGLSITTGQFFFSLGYGFSYIVIILMIASLAFQRREFH